MIYFIFQMRCIFSVRFNDSNRWWDHSMVNNKSNKQCLLIKLNRSVVGQKNVTLALKKIKYSSLRVSSSKDKTWTMRKMSKKFEFFSKWCSHFVIWILCLRLLELEKSFVHEYYQINVWLGILAVVDCLLLNPEMINTLIYYYQCMYILMYDFTDSKNLHINFKVNELTLVDDSSMQLLCLSGLIFWKTSLCRVSFSILAWSLFKCLWFKVTEFWWSKLTYFTKKVLMLRSLLRSDFWPQLDLDTKTSHPCYGTVRRHIATDKGIDAS